MTCALSAHQREHLPSRSHVYVYQTGDLLAARGGDGIRQLWVLARQRYQWRVSGPPEGADVGPRQPGRYSALPAGRLGDVVQQVAQW